MKTIQMVIACVAWGSWSGAVFNFFLLQITKQEIIQQRIQLRTVPSLFRKLEMKILRKNVRTDVPKKNVMENQVMGFEAKSV